MKRLLYNLKVTFKNRELIFWTFAFPIILGTLFFAAFSDMKVAEEFTAIKVAVVKNDKSLTYPVYNQIFESLNNSDEKILDITTSENIDELKEQLEKDEIKGIILFEDGANFPKLTVEQNGISQTILQNFMTEVELSIRSGKQFDDVKFKDTYEQKEELTMVEFYSLLAMTCLYGAMIATKSLDKNLANMTATGKRISVAAVSKVKIVLGSLLTSYIVQLLGLAVLFIYLTTILGIEFSNLPATIIFTAVGSLAGLALGTFIACVIKTKEDNKDGITTGFTMLCCFFAGMMGPQMKFVIDNNVPLLNKINPVAMITDGYYAISNYGIGERFWFDVASLMIFTAILSTISIIVLRRQKYDNI